MKDEKTNKILNLDSSQLSRAQLLIKSYGGLHSAIRPYIASLPKFSNEHQEMIRNASKLARILHGNFDPNVAFEIENNKVLKYKSSPHELTYTTWFREIWIKEGRPGGSAFFRALKKYKGEKGSRIIQHYTISQKDKGPGITLKTDTTVINHFPMSQVQKMVSKFRKEEKSKNMSSKN